LTGRVRELLTTMSTIISLHFPSNAGVVLIFSELINDSRTDQGLMLPFFSSNA